MSKTDNGTEYVFIVKGREYYEIVFEQSDLGIFYRGYRRNNDGAYVSYMPL